MLNFESWSNSRDIQVNLSSLTPIIIKYQLAGEIEVETDNTFHDRYCVTIGNDSRSFFNLHEAERYLWIEWVYPEAVTEYNRAVAEEMDPMDHEAERREFAEKMDRESEKMDRESH